MNKQMTAIIERDGDGYVALCPEVDVASQGCTVSEARDNLVEALALFFETASATETTNRLQESTRSVWRSPLPGESSRVGRSVDDVACDSLRRALARVIERHTIHTEDGREKKRQAMKADAATDRWLAPLVQDSREMCFRQGKPCVYEPAEKPGTIITEWPNGVVDRHVLDAKTRTRCWPDGTTQTIQDTVRLDFPHWPRRQD